MSESIKQGDVVELVDVWCTPGLKLGRHTTEKRDVRVGDRVVVDKIKNYYEHDYVYWRTDEGSLVGGLNLQMFRKISPETDPTPFQSTIEQICKCQSLLFGHSEDCEFFNKRDDRG